MEKFSAYFDNLFSKFFGLCEQEVRIMVNEIRHLAFIYLVSVSNDSVLLSLPENFL